MADRPDIQRSLGLLGATGVGVGAIVGGGILALAGVAFAATGPSAIVAFALNGLIAVLAALSFAELATQFPESGGAYAFAKKVLTVEAAFGIGWMVWFASIVAAVLYAFGLGAFAVIALDDVEYYEDGSHTEPDIAPRVFDLDGKPRELDQHYQEMFEEEGLAALHDLRNRIAAALASLGIEVLGDDDLRKTVPWLKAGEDVAVEPATPGGGITVQDALFHREW